MVIVVVVLSSLLAALLLFSGGRKVAAGSAVTAEAAHLGVPIAGYRLIGGAEVAAAGGLLIGLAWAPLAIAAAAGLVLLFLAAVISHLRVGDPFAKWAPALILALFSVVTLILRIATATG